MNLPVDGEPATPVATTPSIAILPFADMSPKRDQEYFADGVAEEILNALAQVQGLKVIGRTSSFSFKGKSDDLKTIGQKLGVANVLEGSLRKSGGRLRITAQLVKAADGVHLWSQTFDRPAADVFAVQDEIARAVVQALRVKLLPGQSSAAKEYRPESQEAYQNYLLGRHFHQSFSLDSQRRSNAALERAVQADPLYPQAWAALARARLRGGGLGATSYADARHDALAAAQRAVALAPDLPDALAARAQARLAEWDWAGAKADVNRAVEVGPDDPSAIDAMASYLYWTGRTSEMARWALRLVEMDPLNGGVWNMLGTAYWFTGRFDEADRAFVRALEVDPQHAWAVGNRAGALVDAGRPAEALALIQDPSKHVAARAITYHALGNAEASRRELEAMLAKKPSGDKSFLVATVYASRGQADHAFEWLDLAVEEHARALNGLQADPHFRSLRADPRYTAILRKMNLPVD